MIPNVRQALKGLLIPTPFQVVKKTIQDHEVVQTDVASWIIPVVMHPMDPRKLSIKPEGQRRWKWFDAWSEIHLEVDWTIIDSSNRRYRIMASTDWSQSGFYHYELVQGPVESGTVTNPNA